jgi:hypothetical protein
MPRRIQQRFLAVALLHRRGATGGDILEYRLAPQPTDEVAPALVRVRVATQELTRGLAQVQGCVISLTNAAGAGRPRGDADLEGAIESLAKLCLPKTGLASVFRRDSVSHPCLELLSLLVASLLWEASTGASCSCKNHSCAEYGNPLGRQATAPCPKRYCTSCGIPPCIVKHKLGFARHVTHMIRSGEGSPPASLDSHRPGST